MGILEVFADPGQRDTDHANGVEDDGDRPQPADDPPSLCVACLAPHPVC